MNLLLVRHAQSEGNAHGVMQGRAEYPLSARGREQALTAARWLRTQGVTWDAAYCSPQERAVHTASILARELELPRAECHDALREIHAGDIEGLDLDGIQARYPAFAQRPITTLGDFAEFGGEHYEEVVARVQGFREWVEARHRDAGDTVLIVGHGGSLFQLLKLLVCLPLPRIANVRFGNASVTRVRMRERRGAYLGEILWHVPVELMEGTGALFP